MIESCRTCHYFNALRDTCRRYPPTFHPRNTESDYAGSPPTTHPGFWCGEWAAANGVVLEEGEDEVTHAIAHDQIVCNDQRVTLGLPQLDPADVQVVGARWAGAVELVTCPDCRAWMRKAWA